MTASFPRFSHPASPDLDDCDLPELNCDCNQPAELWTSVLSNMQCDRGDISSVFIYKILQYFFELHLTKFYLVWCRVVVCQSGRACSTSMLNWRASNNSLHDSLVSSVNLVNKKEEQLLQLENKLDYVCSEVSEYKDKNICHDKRLDDEKFKSRKYRTLFWFMAILYVARLLISQF
jgi:hypothetical protein